MISVLLDDHRAVAMLGHLVARARRLPMARLQVIAYRSVLRNFNDQGRPQRWQGLAESTKDARDSRYRSAKSKGKKRRKKWVGSGAVPGKIDQATGAYMFRGYSILQSTGALKKSIMAEADGTHGFAVYTRLHSKDGYYYPAVHQFGSLDGKIPARPFMVWQREDIAEIKRILINHIINGAVAS